MTMTIDFKMAEIGDLPRIVDIYNSTIPSRLVTADTEPVTVESKIAWFNEHDESRPLYLIEMENRIVGWLSFQAFYGRPAYQATVEVSIYLDEKYRGNGIGRQAVQKALDECPRLGIKTLLAFIFGHNTPSLKLFEKFGFETWAHMPKIAELDNIERDLVILGKRVN
ncbi:GNAT family N-acetyltransferase [Bacillus massiliglaciei]|uniref:GNAT family N-acetyltransferase n=1 Tax=Bacillus massiliglaciei TaxID=1816693 RepID=UPI000A98BD22|nr:GNAT family N-acetyltransferase [Bacillus massiliglaciei]